MAALTDPPPLTAQAIRSLLHTASLGRDLRLLAVAGSTNQEAMLLAQQGAPDGTVVVADQQTAGKGRLGRSWHSPPGANIYCSVVLRRLPQTEQLPLIPLLTAVAVALALQDVAGLPARLKWPNDVLLNGRKVGGVLCESAGVGQAGAVVVIGVGINVNGGAGGFPEDLRAMATSLAMELGHSLDRAAVLAAVLDHLEKALAPLMLPSPPPPESLLQEYVRLCSTLGRHVQVSLHGTETLEGLAESIAPDGSLRVLADPPAGRRVDVRAGDVIHLR